MADKKISQLTLTISVQILMKLRKQTKLLKILKNNQTKLLQILKKKQMIILQQLAVTSQISTKKLKKLKELRESVLIVKLLLLAIVLVSGRTQMDM